MFRTCTDHVHRRSRVWLQHVQKKSTACSEIIQGRHISRSCPPHVYKMFTTWSTRSKHFTPCPRHVQNMLSTCPEHAQNAFSPFPTCVQSMVIVCSCNVRNTLGTWPDHVQNVCSTCSADVKNMCRKCSWHVHFMLRTCTEYVHDMFDVASYLVSYMVSYWVHSQRHGWGFPRTCQASFRFGILYKSWWFGDVRRVSLEWQFVYSGYNSGGRLQEHDMLACSLATRVERSLKAGLPVLSSCQVSR